MNQSEFLIIGAKGQLGLALQAKYPNAQVAHIDELDITSAESVAGYDWSKIKIILNAAAYTNVDGAESTEGRVTAWRVNAQAVRHLTKAALEHDLTLVHLSTDYVFDGSREPHLETEFLSPLSVYGQSKAAGDLLACLLPNYYVIRTSWIIGDGKNFVRAILELGKRGVNPKVVADQVGRLTFTSELVRAIDHLLKNHVQSGIYNVTNGGEPASLADITREIFKAANFNLKVTDVTTGEYYAGKTGIAPRPFNSAFDLTKLHQTGFKSYDWRDDLKTYVQMEVKT